jgi:hypothetical protein
MSRPLSIVCALIIVASCATFFFECLHADELVTLSSGRKVLLKDDGTWVYANAATRSDLQTGSESADEIIRSECLKQWADDFRMRAYCERQQRDAVQVLGTGKPGDISEGEFITVRRRCTGEWPRDFRLRAYCEKQQFVAIRELKRR